jgi:hypothetical protein
MGMGLFYVTVFRFFFWREFGTEMGDFAAFLRGGWEKRVFWCGDLLVSLWWIASLSREKDASFLGRKNTPLILDLFSPPMWKSTCPGSDGAPKCRRSSIFCADLSWAAVKAGDGFDE